MESRRILGSSPQTQLLQKLVQQAAATTIPVLVCGEPGVGREFLGELLHHQSGRSGPFLRLNCAGLSEPVIHAELQKRLERASGGTLFLDSFEDIGKQSIVTGDVRLVAATSMAGIDDHMPGVTFGIRIVIAPLRERRSDIPVMIDHFTKEFARQSDKSVRGVQPAAMKKLMSYQWPGNIRELRDAIERAVTNTTREFLDLEDFAFLLTADEERPLQFMIPGATIHEIEKEAILRTLEHTGGSTTAAARILKMSVRKIQYKLKQYRNGDEAASIAKTKVVAGR